MYDEPTEIEVLVFKTLKFCKGRSEVTVGTLRKNFKLKAAAAVWLFEELERRGIITERLLGKNDEIIGKIDKKRLEQYFIIN